MMATMTKARGKMSSQCFKTLEMNSMKVSIKL